MKKRRNILICFAVFFILCLIFRNSKPIVINYIRQNNLELTQFSKSLILSNDFLNMETTYNGWRVTCYADQGIVEFVVKSRGIAPSSTHAGFYYSANDTPIGFHGAVVNFIKDDSRWRWEEENSDNRGFTEKITDNWYWFEASF